MRSILYRLRPACLLCTFVASLALSACDTAQPEIDIELEMDFSEVIAAIRDANSSLDDKLALIEATWNNGLADNQAAMKMVQEAVASLGGTMEEKLAAIEAAVQAGTTGLETKLALIEAAMAAGFADNQAQMELLQQAIASLSGPLDQKLEAIESAVKAGTTSLESKIGLIDAAIRGGFADDAAAQELLNGVLATLGETMEEKLAGIQAAIGGKTLSLSAKMTLIDAAVQGGFADSKTAQEMIQSALGTLEGSVNDKLAALEAAMQSHTTSIETKMGLIEAAADVATGETKLGLIQQAVASLSGSVNDKLAAIESAIGSQATTLDTKLGLVSGALDTGLLNAETAMGSIQTAIQSAGTGLGTLEADIQEKMAAVTTALGQLTTAVTTDNLAAALVDILSAIQGQPDLGTTLDAMLKAIQDMGRTMGMAPFSLTILGNPDFTMTAGEDIRVLISVNPVDTLIDASRLKLDRTELKQFFPVSETGAMMSAKPDTFFIRSLVPIPTTPGQYEATIAGRATDAIWTVSKLSIAAAYGDAQNPKYVATEPFQVEMMARPLNCFNWWCYPYASMRINSGGDPASTHKDVVNSIYLALDRRIFKTQDQSESREYPIDNLESVTFLPRHDSIAPVFITLDKEKRFIRFTPDTLGLTYHDYWPEKDPDDVGGRLLWWKFRDSTGVKFETIRGQLILTDNRNVKDTVRNASSYGYNRFEIAWYNSTWYPNVSWISKDQIHDDNTVDLDDVSLIRLFTKLGFEPSGLKDARFEIDQDYTSTGTVNGYKRVSAQVIPEQKVLRIKFLDPFAVGDKFLAAGRFRLRISPSQTDPSFKVETLQFHYLVDVRITE